MSDLTNKYIEAAATIAKKSNVSPEVVVTAELLKRNEAGCLVTSPYDFKVTVTDLHNWRKEVKETLASIIDAAETIVGLWIEQIFVGVSRYDVFDYEATRI